MTSHKEEAEGSREDFYVGYHMQAPAALARWMRPRVAALVALPALVAVALVAAQKPFGAGVHEFGRTRAFEGTLLEHPYPCLVVGRPGLVEQGGSAASVYLLVAPGKFGAQAIVGIRGRNGKRVRIQGSLVYRDDQTMIEAALVEELPEQGGASALGTVDLGTHTFRGEIVDSKCFLGVMKPGNLKTHRSCATLCISGGIPPVLLVRERDGTASYLLLTDAAGEAVNDRVLHLVAEPIEITGNLLAMGELLVLQADPSTYRRLP
jgi:hypothetical protein